MPTIKPGEKARSAAAAARPAESKPRPTVPSAATASATGTSKKRKMDADLPKFYAVRVGNKPGVYLTWAECQDQTRGCPGASYKKFNSREDAEAFVAGKKTTSAVAKEEEKFYAVAVGSVPGIYTDWDEASLAIKGCKGPKYKRFKTREEALDFVRAYGNEAAQSWLSKHGAVSESRSKKIKLDDKPAAAEPARQLGSESDVMCIFTDGSSLANGRAGAAAGVGVYFGDGDKRNVSERLKGLPQTNQRAELTAILRALELSKSAKKIRIITDSKYSIDCSTNWYRSWQKNNWKKSNGDEVLNQDLIKGIRALIEERDRAGFQTGFQWVKGHSTDVGNIAADRLAVAGAKKTS